MYNYSTLYVLKTLDFIFHNKNPILNMCLQGSLDREESYKHSSEKCKWNPFSQTNLEKGIQKKQLLISRRYTWYITFKLLWIVEQYLASSKLNPNSGNSVWKF